MGQVPVPECLCTDQTGKGSQACIEEHITQSEHIMHSARHNRPATQEELVIACCTVCMTFPHTRAHVHMLNVLQWLRQLGTRCKTLGWAYLSSLLLYRRSWFLSSGQCNQVICHFRRLRPHGCTLQVTTTWCHLESLPRYTPSGEIY